MSRAERRARGRWGCEPPQDPLVLAASLSGEMGDAFGAFAAVMNAVAAKIAANGGPSHAQLEALNRWALPTSSAFRRATADMNRLADQLAGIGHLDGAA